MVTICLNFKCCHSLLRSPWQHGRKWRWFSRNSLLVLLLARQISKHFLGRGGDKIYRGAQIKDLRSVLQNIYLHILGMPCFCDCFIIEMFDEIDGCVCKVAVLGSLCVNVFLCASYQCSVCTSLTFSSATSEISWTN